MADKPIKGKPSPAPETIVHDPIHLAQVSLPGYVRMLWHSVMLGVRVHAILPCSYTCLFLS